MKPLTLTALFCTAATAAMAAEDMIGSPAEGQHFARELCAACHYVEADGPVHDPMPPRAFTAIAADPKTTEASLRVFLQSPHIDMPDFILTRQQTDDVVAYILSLASE